MFVKRLSSSNPSTCKAPGRAGFTVPAVAVALLIGMMGLALVIDRLWLDAADLELTTAAEAAALNGARSLASDDLLKQNRDREAWLYRARRAAAETASFNTVAGEPVELSTDTSEHIQFGKLVLDEDTGQWRLDEAAPIPTVVHVIAKRTRADNNPVGLFVAGVTGVASGDVVARVEATIDNHVVGVRPLVGATVPVLPLAIWLRDPENKVRDTWENQIDRQQGNDEYGVDPETGAIDHNPDGIREIVLRSQAISRGKGNKPNVVLLDMASDLSAQRVEQQFAKGLTEDDLATTNGELRVSNSQPGQYFASPDLGNLSQNSLQNLIGEPRICLIYEDSSTGEGHRHWKVACPRLVAIRIVAVQSGGDGTVMMVVQPTVLATRSALLGVSDQSGPVDGGQPGTNRYIYKLMLTK